MIPALIHHHFGTARGAVRLGLSYFEQTVGLAPTKTPAREEVTRLVFVCHGNICRSAYAQGFAERLGLRSASFGLSATNGLPAHPPVTELARLRGLDLSGHRATSVDDFSAQAGDYLLAMEIRHLRRLAALNSPASTLPRGLLGSHARFPVPHLHDPYGLSAAYLPVCLDRIEAALGQLWQLFPNARSA